MRSVLLFIERIVLSTTSTGTASNVFFTHVENNTKSSWVMASSKASWCNFLLITWKIFPIELRSGLRVGMVNFRAANLSQAVLDFTLFCDGSPFYKNNVSLGLADFLNMLAQCSQIEDENVFALVLSWHSSAANKLSHKLLQP